MKAPKEKHSPASSNGGPSSIAKASGLVQASSGSSPSKILACVACRNSKVKCISDGPQQCKRCLDHGLTCIRPEYQRLKKAKAKLASFQRETTVTKDLESKSLSDMDENVDVPPPKLDKVQESPTSLFNSAFYDKSAQLLSHVHIVRLDVKTEWDPVSVGIMDLETSRQLFNTFMVKLEPLLSFFDPRIHSYEYVRSNSCLLFTTMCWLAATVSSFPAAERIMHDLKAHIDNVLLPAIYCQNLRSVEIVQGFLMLAAYLRPAQNPSEDRSWTLLGHAIRVASDLGIHSRILSTSQHPTHQHLSSAAIESNLASSSGTDQSPTAKKIEIWHQRNKERAWMHIWLHEASSSQYTGRVSLLSKDPIVEGSRGWHLHSEALHTDVVFVALIELRSLLAQNKELFHMLSSRTSAAGSSSQSERASLNGHASQYDTSSTTHSNPSSAASDASFVRHYLQRCHRDLSSWEERWVIDSVRSGSQPRPLRLELGSLYICYARMQLLSLPLQSTSLDPALTTLIVSDLHTVSIRYLTDFCDRTSPQRLAHSYNSICVTATYAVVIALKLTKLAPNYPFINSSRILRLVREVSRYLREGGNWTPHQNGSSLSYARYIDQLLDMESNSSQNGTTSKGDAATTKPSDAEHRGGPEISAHHKARPSADLPPHVTPTARLAYADAPTSDPGTFGPKPAGSYHQSSPIEPHPHPQMMHHPAVPSSVPMDLYHPSMSASLGNEPNQPQWSFLANDPELFAWARSFLNDELNITLPGASFS